MCIGTTALQLRVPLLVPLFVLLSLPASGIENAVTTTIPAGAARTFTRRHLWMDEWN
jgi:hypothetical protein